MSHRQQNSLQCLILIVISSHDSDRLISSYARDIPHDTFSVTQNKLRIAVTHTSEKHLVSEAGLCGHGPGGHNEVNTCLVLELSQMMKGLLR